MLKNQLGIEISDQHFELASLIEEYTEFDHRENKVIITSKRELAHGTSLSVAAGILGVAWYIAIPIVDAARATRVAGSIACP